MSSYNSHHTATSGFNNSFSNQPSLLGSNVNEGKQEEVLVDATGRVRAAYRSTGKEKDIQEATKEIRDYIKANNKSNLGDEVATGIPFVFSMTNVIPSADLVKPPPIGAGPKPEYANARNPTDDEKFAVKRWESLVEGLDKSARTKYDNYRSEMRHTIANIMLYFCSVTVKQSLEKKREFLDAQGDNSNMLNFLVVLEECVRKIPRPNLSAEKLRDKAREDIKNLILTLKVADYGNSLLYVQMLQQLFSKYKAILLEEKVNELPAGLDNLARAEKIQEKKNEIQKDIDRDEAFIQRIYWEYYGHAMLGKYQKAHDDKATLMHCVKRETPYRREVIGGVVTGGIDNMLTEFTAIANASTAELGQAVHLVKPKSFKRTLNRGAGGGEDKRGKIDINNQRDTPAITEPCKYCLVELDFKRGALNHEWKDCIFNEQCPKFVGADNKAERKAKADKWKLHNAQRDQSAGRQHQPSNRGRGRHHGRGGRPGR